VNIKVSVLTVAVARPARTELYVVAVALIPLVFALLLLAVFLRRPRKDAGPEGIVGVAAVLLAILPIRLVLVPSEISGLTLVDYGLGVEMAILAALACFVVWLGLAPSDTERARPDAGDLIQ
jgi:hypothetical protein